MATQNWLRSPAAARTLHHAVLCYHRFLLLFALHPAATLVPTLLVDVAWHTALCSPARYAAASRAFAGRFINHDDAWRDTQALYKQAFGDDYDVCRCWWCEVWLEEKEAATTPDADDDDRISERAAARMERAMQAEKARMKTARR
ncbi:hypothetical protein BKA80DRAFT_285302 [Phyllosticta citrichinensis]